MEEIGKWQWLDFDELSSTNDKAIELSAEAPAARFVVTAQHQTNGRGRRGRSWLSEEGNLFMSLAMPFAISDLNQLVFLISLSLYEAVKKIAPHIDLYLKWPNDLLADNRKISGILLEKGENGYIIAGIGVNIVSAPDLGQMNPYQSVSLKSLGTSTDRISVLRQFLQELDKNEQLRKSHGFSAIKELWLQRVKGLGTEIVVNGEKNTIKGIFEGLDEQGHLLLRQGKSINKIFAGDVIYSQQDEKKNK